ncbi:selenocysteine-specific elongation factor [Strigomonas culicis]|nr:selenocysteine-specific elongation factor [Strigomonas culicis]|eukprot:EPY19445.1 selenocysteine-specific elongation factor [Strigomonas culicis]
MSGVVRVGDTVLLPEQQVTKKVKGLQMFRRPVEQAHKGERVGLSVTQFDPALMERGTLCGVTTGAEAAGGPSGQRMQRSSVWVARAHRVRYHALPCDNHTKFHITIGHTTVMGTMRYFARPAAAAPFDCGAESTYMEALEDEAFAQYAAADAQPPPAPGTPLPLAPPHTLYFAILLLEAPVLATVGSAFVAMRLDVERENFCRIALAGELVAPLRSEVKCVSGDEVGVGDGAADLPNWRSLNVVRFKDRDLAVDRVVDGRTCIAAGVVHDTAQEGSAAAQGSAARKERDVMLAEVQKFIGLAVLFCPATAEGESKLDADTGCVKGTVDSAFGKSGKVRLVFEKAIFTQDGSGSKKKGKVAADKEAEQTDCFITPGRILLRLKKYPLASHSSLKQ